MKFFVGGNWKMNGNKKLVTEMIEALENIDMGKIDVMIAPPAPYFSLFQQILKEKENGRNKDIIIASQNIHQCQGKVFLIFFCRWSIYRRDQHQYAKGI